MGSIRNLFGGRRRNLERDLSRELQFHLDRRVADLVRDGLDETQARRRASVEFGGRAQVQEDVRDTWAWRWLADRGRDVRFAARALARTPGFTMAVVLSLAIGIGASAAIFSLVDQVLLRMLPVREPDRLVLLGWNGSTLSPGLGSGSRSLLSERTCRDLQASDAFFDGVFCRHPYPVNVSIESQAEFAGAEIVSGSYFAVLGIQPALGRLIDRSDDLQPGAHPVVVLSYDYWRTRFGAAPDVVGRRILVNGHPMNVIGVAPRDFRGVDVGDVPSLWIPVAMKRQALPSWADLVEAPRTRWLHVFGRLKPGVTVEQTASMLQPWFAQMLRADMQLEDFPVVSEQQRGRYLASTMTVEPGGQGRSNLRETLDVPLRVLLAATVLLHLLASLNVASLLLARGAGRTREIRTRMALGASRGRVIGLLVADSVVIAMAGAAVGLLVAPLVSHALITFLQRDPSTLDLSSRLDLRVFAFAAGASLLTTALCGLALLWQSGRLPLVASLRMRGGTGSVRLRKALVIGQMAFTLILLVGAGLFMQTLARLHDKGPGFTTTNVMTFGIDPRQSGYADDRSRRLMGEVLATVQALPSVDGAAIAAFDLLSGGSWSSGMTIAADTRVATDRDVHLNPVSPEFFGLMGVRLVAGRGFDDRDSYPPGQSGPYRSVVINERFARRYFGGLDPIGRRVGLGAGPDARTDIEVVGVVSDFAYRDLREETEHAFFPFLEGGGEAGTFYVKMRESSTTALATLRAAVARVDTGLPLLAPRTLDDQVARSLMTERMLATISSGFGIIALLLSVVGLYGVMSFVVTGRTREIGIRLALGATRSTAVWHVVRDAMLMMVAGAAIALPCVWGVGRLIEAQLFGVTSIDAPTIVTASLLLLVAALAGATFPAWRAASVRPTEALRAE